MCKGNTFNRISKFILQNFVIFQKRRDSHACEDGKTSFNSMIFFTFVNKIPLICIAD